MKNISLGAGLCLRLEFIDQFLKAKPKIQAVEIISENWFRAGPHHEKLQIISDSYKIHMHCVGMNIGGADPINKKYLDNISNLKAIFKPHHISDHLCFQKYNQANHHDLLPIAYNKNALSSVIERVQNIQDHLGEAIGLENLSYYLKYKESNISEADFLNKVCEETGAFILLDLNNLLVNQINLNVSSVDFINEINFEFVKEIHLAGASSTGRLIIDDHGGDLSVDHIELLQKVIIKLKHNLSIFYERDTNLTDLNQSLDQISLIKKEIKGHG